MQLTTSGQTNMQKHPHPNQKNLLILILQLLALAESFITNFPWLCSLLTPHLIDLHQNNPVEIVRTPSRTSLQQ
jgi:hypothetical protein